MVGRIGWVGEQSFVRRHPALGHIAVEIAVIVDDACPRGFARGGCRWGFRSRAKRQGGFREGIARGWDYTLRSKSSQGDSSRYACIG